MIIELKILRKMALQFGGECEKYRVPTSVLGGCDTMDTCVLAWVLRALVLLEFEYIYIVNDLMHVLVMIRTACARTVGDWNL